MNGMVPSELRVRYAETDAMGIVHHSRYLPIMEEARVAYLRDIGHPYQSVRDEGLDFTVLVGSLVIGIVVSAKLLPRLVR